MIHQSPDHDRAIIIRTLIETDIRIRLNKPKLTREYMAIIRDIRKLTHKLESFSKYELLEEKVLKELTK